jgi:parallel beta-helix repeat protein
MSNRWSPKLRRWGPSLAGWLIGPERLVGIGAFAIAGLGAFFAGLPAVVVGVIALVALAATVVIIHYSLKLWDRYQDNRQKSSTGGGSHGILVEDSEDAIVEGNDISGADVGIGQYRSGGGAIRGNRIDGGSQEVTEDQNINYGHQEIGINKGIVNKEATPRARLYGVSENVPDGDNYLSTYRIVLEGRPLALVALVESMKVVELDLEEDRDYSAGFAVATGENPQGYPICETPNPAPGSYLLKVRLSEAVEGLTPKLALPMQTRPA